MVALLIASSLAAVLALVGTRLLITVLGERGASQPILQKNAANIVVPPHAHKAGTPTMGGLAIVGAALLAYVVTHVRRGVVFSDQTLVVIGGIVAMAALGAVDDVKKLLARQNRGVYWKVKGVVSFLMSIAIAAALVVTTDIDTRISFVRADAPGWDLGPVVWVVWAGTIIFATTNAVNVTDGLDGLAAGSALIGFAVFTGIAFWKFRNPGIYGDVVNPFDLAVLAAAFAGASAAFLWWNAAPAQIFMGDVGALALGSAQALLAITTNTHLLLLLVCAVNVVEAGSVGLQMLVFRASGRRRRLFRLSPIHHHFELVGWPETKVIIRVWLIAGASASAAAGLFLADYTNQL